jgi:hypothetical protein
VPFCCERRCSAFAKASADRSTTSTQPLTPVVMGPGLRRDDVVGHSIFKQQKTSRGAGRPKFCTKIVPREMRAQGTPGARCTRGLVCKSDRKRTRAHRFSGGNPAFPAQWCYGLFRALPGDRAFLPPSPARLSANLMPASGHQDHTSSPSACQRSRQKRRLASIASHPA